MKFYIAGKFEEIDVVRDVYAKVQKLGHEISYDWTTHVKIKPYEENVEIAQRYAENEIKAILDSDVFVYLSNERGTTLHMEYGAALAKAWQGGQIKIFIVGENNNRSPWYFNHLVTRVSNLDGVFQNLEVK
jgi:hypothetical protein